MSEPKSALENVAPELLTQILSSLYDLESLDCLLRASPASYRLFSIHNISKSIFETILSSGNTHTYTIALIRITLLIRSNTLPSSIHNLTIFKDLLRHETSPHRWTPPRWTENPTTFPDAPSTFYLGLLATNRKIQHLTTACLEHYLEDFRQLRPYNAAEFHYDASTFATFAPELLSPWQNKLPHQIFHYPVHDTGPPSWVERQRIERAFWRIQVSLDLRKALSTKTIVWDSSNAAEILNEKEKEWDAADIYDVPAYIFSDDGNENVFVLKENAEMMHIATDLETELVQTVLDYYYAEGQETVIDENEYWSIQKRWAASADEVSSSSSEHRAVEWGILDKTYRSETWSFFGRLTGSQWQHENRNRFLSPLQHAPFAPWRRFGFAICKFHLHQPTPISSQSHSQHLNNETS